MIMNYNTSDVLTFENLIRIQLINFFGFDAEDDMGGYFKD